MTGIIITKNGKRYVFRNDHGFETGFWAWDIDNPDIGWRGMTHKWSKLPRKCLYIETFNIDYPPATVSYLPIIGSL